MIQYLLDTNICVHYMKGEYDLSNKVSRVGLNNCYISEITIAELLFGVENSAEEYWNRNRDRVARLRFAFSGRILLNGDCFDEYARQKSALRKIGRIVGEFDLLIGTSAIGS